jgi:hypothetical protein
MEATNQSWNITHGAMTSFPSTMSYTVPTFCEASQSSILINPETGRRLGVDFSAGEMLATSYPPPAVDLGPNTGTQITEWQSVRVARRLLEVLYNLERIATLQENWDTFGSGRTSAIAANTARDLIWRTVVNLAAHKGADGTPNDVAPLSGGGVQVEWRGNAGTIEVEISADGHFGYLLRQEPDGRGETQEDDNVPEEGILDLISSVFQ